MKTIQMTIDEALLDRVDEVVQELGTDRSAFIREALEQAIHEHIIKQKEEQHAEGYAKHPVQTGEFDEWVDEQVWGEP